jgi:acyl carrier protein
VNDLQALGLIKEALLDVAPTRGREFDAIGLDTEIEALAMDSVATMEMVGFIEDRLARTFPDEELSGVRTLRDLVRLIRRDGV